MAGGIGGSTVANKIINFIGRRMRKETGATKAIAEKGIEASNFVRGFDGRLKEFIDTADSRDGMLGVAGRFLQDVAPTMNTTPSVLQNLSKDATASVEWDLLSRRTLVEIIPEYLARITQNTESMATGKAAEKMVYSKQSESFMTESDAIAEATDKFVRRDEITEYRSRSDELLNRLFSGARISPEARMAMSEQLHTDLSRGWNFDVRRYVNADAFESHLDPDAVAELRDFFRDKFKAKEKVVDGKSSWDFEYGEQTGKLLGSLQNQGKNLQNRIPEMQSSINEFVATGDKDLLRATGWIDSTSGRDQFNLQRMNNLMTGRLELDDLQSEWERDRLKEERGAEKTKWQERDRGQWVVDDNSTVEPVKSERAEKSNLPPVMSSEDRSIISGLNAMMGQLSTTSKASLDRLAEMATNNVEASEFNSQQVQILTEIRDLLIAQQMTGLSSEDAAMGAELLKKFTAAANWEQPKWYNTLTSGIVDGAKAGAGMLSSYYGALGNAASSTVGFLKEKGTAAWGKIQEKGAALSDVYINGMQMPALRAQLIKAGRYVDSQTGKVITSLDDISGEVIDKVTGNVVISAEDYRGGLFDNRGNTLFAKLGAGAQKLISGGMEALGSYYGFLGNTAGNVLTWGKEKITDLDRKLRTESDVYVKNRMGDGPALLRTKLLRGAYFDIEGNPIFSVGDITGPVFDEDGNQLISDEDISAGLVDPQGDDIKTAGILGNGLGIVGAGIGLAKKGASKAFSALKTYYSGLGQISGSLLDKLKHGFSGFGGSEVAETMNVTATNVYLNGNIIREGEPSVAEKAGTTVSSAVSTVREKTGEMSEQLKAATASVKERASAELNTATAKASELTGAAKAKAKETKDSLLGREIGEDTTLVADANGNVSLKTEEGVIPAGDGSTKGYMAALLAYFHRQSQQDSADGDGDGLRDGGWRSKLFGRKKTEDDSTEDKPKEGNRKAGKGMLAGMAGLLGLGGGSDEDSGDGDSFAGDVAAEVAGEYAADKLGGKGGDSDSGGRRRTRTPKGKGNLASRAWGAIKGAGSSVKEMATNAKGRSIMGNAKALTTGTAGLVAGLGKGIKSFGGKLTSGPGSSLLKKAGLFGARAGLGLLGGTLAAVGGVAAAPIVASALAIAGTAWTAYEVASGVGGFLFRRSEAEPIERYRFLQYGLNPDNKEHRVFLRILEAGAADNVEYMGQDGTNNRILLGDDPEWLYEAMDYIGIDAHTEYEEDPENGERFGKCYKWFKNRFEPVFLLHHGHARQLDEDVDLLDIDDEMDDELKHRFVDRSYYPNNGESQSPYFVDTPFIEGYTIGYDDIDAQRDALLAEYKAYQEGDKEESGIGSKIKSALMMATPVGMAMKAAETLTSKDAGTGTKDEESSGSISKILKGGLMAVPGVGIGAMLYNMFSDDDEEVKVKVPQFKTEDGSDISHLDAIRFYQYGVGKLTDRTAALLYRLERAVSADLAYAGDTVEWSGNLKRIWHDMATALGYSRRDGAARGEWNKWFTITFLPVFSAYAAALRSKSVNEIHSPKLSKKDMWEVAKVIVLDIAPRFAGMLRRGHEAVANDDMVTKLLLALEEQAKVKEKEFELTTPNTKGPVVDGVAPVMKLTSTVTSAASKGDTEAKTSTPTSTPTTVKRKLETTKTATGGDGFVVPADGNISSPYGNRVHPIDGTKKFHAGIDIAGPEGTPIVASASGVISRRDYSRDYGNVIYIENDDGTHSRYAHMYRFEPGYRVGDRVEQGAKIGEMGSTGASTGSHLHFEVRKDTYDKNSALNPLDLFNGDKATKAREEVAKAVKAAEDEKSGKIDTSLEGENTIASTVKGEATNHDAKREATARVNTPLVKPANMVPSTPVMETVKVGYTEDEVATLAPTQPVTAKKLPTINHAPVTPVRKPKQAVEGELIVEAEVLQQKRAQLGQEVANAKSEQQLELIGMILHRQLESNYRMEELMAKVVDNTMATAERVTPVTQQAQKDTGSVKPKPDAKAATGKELNALFASREKTKPLSHPLLMGRNK